MESLVKNIRQQYPNSCGNLINHIVGSVDSFFQGCGQSDDLTLVSFRITSDI